MRHKNRDLLIATAIAALNVIGALLPGRPPVLGTLLALPLIFLLPGYTLTELLFYRSLLGPSYRLLLSLGLSIAIAILGGFILNLFPAGLQTTSWAIYLSVVTAVFSLVTAWLRRRRQVQHPPEPQERMRISLYDGLLLALAAIVASLSIVYASVGAARQSYPGFTQLWMLPANQANNSCTVSIGVRNFETRTITYRVTMAAGQQQESLMTWPAIKLAPQKEWSQLVSIPPQVPDGTTITVRLYRLDKPQTVYQEVHRVLHRVNSGGGQACQPS
ncbi:MAG: DUF1616 domain-containing protein [Ktedonobacteraceae bacterium]|nr:DUF1616 domain-containing protein [Ktedonobacteraceae bacterium]